MLQAGTIAVFLLSLVLLVFQSVSRGNRDNNAVVGLARINTLLFRHNGEAAGQ